MTPTCRIKQVVLTLILIGSTHSYIVSLKILREYPVDDIALKPAFSLPYSGGVDRFILYVLGRGNLTVFARHNLGISFTKREHLIDPSHDQRSSEQVHQVYKMAAPYV